MMSDLKAEEDELLHGENCWTKSEINQMSFNSSDDKIQLFQGVLYDWENYFTVIGWEQANLSLILNLHCSAN